MTAVIDTPVGRLRVTVRNGRITEITECCDAPQGEFPPVDDYFSGRSKAFPFETELQGTEFQIAVWKECARIPYGSTATYGEIARAIGRPGAARAVGNALNANRLLLAVPCHRVTGAGKLGGFRLGTEAKKYLLRLEGSLTGEP